MGFVGVSGEGKTPLGNGKPFIVEKEWNCAYDHLFQADDRFFWNKYAVFLLPRVGCRLTSSRFLHSNLIKTTKLDSQQNVSWGKNQCIPAN